MEPSDEEEAAASENPGDRVEIRRAPEKEPILDASLVLSSQSIKHWIEFDGAQFILTLEAGDAPNALVILKQYEAENEAYQATEPAVVPPIDLYLSPLLHLLIPVLVFFWAGLTPWGDWLMQRGGADAHRILNGEWWRCLTATTLHLDHEHFLSNMLSGFFILNLLRRRCGPGTSMLLLTVAAGITNYAVAVFSNQNHFSIGFSTVVFAALGLLAGIETLNLPRHPIRTTRNLSPLIAAFFLAVLVGIGENIDIKAHFFGLGIGALVSPLAIRMEKKIGTMPWQFAEVVLVYMMYAGAWILAQR